MEKFRPCFLSFFFSAAVEMSRLRMLIPPILVNTRPLCGKFKPHLYFKIPTENPLYSSPVPPLSLQMPLLQVGLPLVQQK